MLLNNSYYYVRITGRRQIFISKTLALKKHTQTREIVYKNNLISRNFWLAGNSKKIKQIV